MVIDAETDPTSPAPLEAELGYWSISSAASRV